MGSEKWEKGKNYNQIFQSDFLRPNAHQTGKGFDDSILFHSIRPQTETASDFHFPLSHFSNFKEIKIQYCFSF